MADPAELYDVSGDDVVLRVHAQPGAARTAITGRHGTALKVRVAAPPVDGRANEALRAALADAFAVAQERVTLAGGGASRVKRFRIDGIAPDEFGRRLSVVIAEAEGAGNGGRPGSVPRAER